MIGLVSYTESFSEINRKVTSVITVISKNESNYIHQKYQQE